jgi:peroxiredoxin
MKGIGVMLLGSALLCSAATFGIASASVPPAPVRPAPPEERAPRVEPGAKAPDFRLKNLEGKEWVLSSTLREGKVVVIEWFNPECRAVATHHREHSTMRDLFTRYKDRGVAWVAVDSERDGLLGARADRLRRAAMEWQIEYPILRDSDAEVAKLYGARTTPDIFVIGRDGIVLYTGAVDDSPDGERIGAVNHLAMALEAALAGTTLDTQLTEPVGCPIREKR